MRQPDAIKIFEAMDRNNRRVFTAGDFRKMFPDDGDRAMADGISRLIVGGHLERAAKGVYVFANSRQPRTHLLYEVARTLRRGCHTYLSLESALAEYGVISQIPVGHHTFVTTGRRGEFKTDYGTIEFTHTTRDPAEFVSELIDNGRPLPIASAERAYRDLRRVGRNLQMVQMDELRAEVARQTAKEETDAEFC